MAFVRERRRSLACCTAVVSRPGTARTRPEPSSLASALEVSRWKGPFVVALALATRSEPFSAPGWLFELKYDGFRLLAKKDGADVVLRYRTGRNATSVFSEVAAAVAALPARRALLDGDWLPSVPMAAQISRRCARGR